MGKVQDDILTLKSAMRGAHGTVRGVPSANCNPYLNHPQYITLNILQLPYTERHIIEQARQILEKYESDEALRFVETNEIKPSLHNIVYFGAYLDGARAMLNRLRDDAHGKINLSNWKGKEGAIYDEAILALISSDKHKMNMYLENRYDIMFRNHQRDAKGRLKSVEAYFAKTVQRVVEAE